MRKGVVVLGLLLAVTAVAVAVPTINWGATGNPAQCETRGQPVINVVQDVENTVDSGTQPNIWWAKDNLTRQIQVFDQGDGTYCVLVQYEGEFWAPLAGIPSPHGNGTLTGEEAGTFQGDIYTVIDGDLKEHPDLATRGRLPTVDYECDLSASQGNFPPTCPGHPGSWQDKYFDSWTRVESSFDFQYTARQNCGRLTQSSDGYAGDIFCQ